LQACIVKTDSHVEWLEKAMLELGALPQSSGSSTRTNPPGCASLQTSATDGDVEQISQTSGKGKSRSIRSLGNCFFHKPGIVNSRIQHFEGRIQEVVGTPTLPGGMEQIETLDAHIHALQQAAPSPRGETQVTAATSTPHVAAGSLLWPSNAATMEQHLTFHDRKASESCGGSTHASLSSTGGSSEFSALSLSLTGNRSPNSLDQDSLDCDHDVSSKTRSRGEPELCVMQPNPVGLSFTPAANAVQGGPSPRSGPVLFTHEVVLSSAQCHTIASV